VRSRVHHFAALVFCLLGLILALSFSFKILNLAVLLRFQHSQATESQRNIPDSTQVRDSMPYLLKGGGYLSLTKHRTFLAMPGMDT
jgi:hypothetical protein